MCATASADTPRLCVYSAASYLLCNQSHSGESRHLERVKASLQSDAYIRLPASNMTRRRQRDRPGRSTLGLHVTILRLPSSSRLDGCASATLQLWTSDGVMTAESSFIDTDHVEQPVPYISIQSKSTSVAHSRATLVGPSAVHTCRHNYNEQTL